MCIDCDQQDHCMWDWSPMWLKTTESSTKYLLTMHSTFHWLVTRHGPTKSIVDDSRCTCLNPHMTARHIIPLFKSIIVFYGIERVMHNKPIINTNMRIFNIMLSVPRIIIIDMKNVMVKYRCMLETLSKLHMQALCVDQSQPIRSLSWRLKPTKSPTIRKCWQCMAQLSWMLMIHGVSS